MNWIVTAGSWLLLSFVSVVPIQQTAAQGDLMITPERFGLAATFTERLGDGGVREILAEVLAGAFAGVGDLGPTCSVFGTTLITADENGATPETYRIVVRRAMPGVFGPQPDPNGLLFRSGPFQTPPAVAGRGAWIIRTSFQTPVQVPCWEGFYHGIEVTPAPWPQDGQSVFAAYYQPPAGSNGRGDNPRAGSPSLAWRLEAGIATRADPACSLYMGVFTLGPVLSMGSIDPANTRQVPTGSTCFGAAGMFPDVWNLRRDGLEARISDLRPGGGTALLLLGVRLSQTPLVVPGLGARIWMDPASTLIVLGTAPLGSGDAIVPIAAPQTLPVTLATGIAVFQAVVAGPALSQPAFSNAIAVRF